MDEIIAVILGNWNNSEFTYINKTFGKMNIFVNQPWKVTITTNRDDHRPGNYLQHMTKYVLLDFELRLMTHIATFRFRFFPFECTYVSVSQKPNSNPKLHTSNISF